MGVEEAQAVIRPEVRVRRAALGLADGEGLSMFLMRGTRQIMGGLLGKDIHELN